MDDTFYDAMQELGFFEIDLEDLVDSEVIH